MLFRRTFIPCCLAFALLMTLLPAAPVHGEGPKDVLQLIPDDAWGFVVLKSLSDLDNKAVEFKELLGLQYPTPLTPMALGMLNLIDKVDMDQPVCIVLMDAKKYGSGMNPGQAAIMLLPVKDAKALVESLAVKDVEEEDAADDEESEGDKKPADEDKKPKDRKAVEAGKKDAEGEEGVSRISIMGQTAFAAAKGKYVIVGQNQDCVIKAAKTKKTMAVGFAEARAAALEQGNLYISLSIKTIVEATKQMWEPLLQMAAAPTDPEGKNIKTLIKMLEESSAFDLSVKLDKNGLTLLALVVPYKDSDLEKLMKDGKNTDKSLLAVLPVEKYLIAIASTGGYSEHAKKFGGQGAVADLVKQAGAKGLNEEAVKAMDAELLKLAKSNGPSAVCVSLLPEGTDGMFGVSWVWQPKDPQEAVESLRKIYKTAWTVAEGKAKEGDKKKDAEEDADDDEEEDEDEDDKPAIKQDDIAKLKQNIVHAADAETVDGIKVDTITVKLEGLGEMLDMEADEVGLLQKVVGKEVVVRFGAVDNKHFVLTIGGGKKRFEAACKHLKSPGESLDKEASIKELSALLPGSRGFELFIAVDNVLQAVKAVAKALGEEEEFPIDMATVNAPLAMSSAMVGPVAQVNIVIPTKLIKAVKEAIDKQMAAGAGDFDEDDDEEDEDAEDNDEDDDEQDDDDDDAGQDDEDE